MRAIAECLGKSTATNTQELARNLLQDLATVSKNFVFRFHYSTSYHLFESLVGVLKLALGMGLVQADTDTGESSYNAYVRRRKMVILFREATKLDLDTSQERLSLQ